MPRTILYVRGFHPSTRARDLAYEFERFGPLIRCDIPALRSHNSSASPYAFVEFRSSRDAATAFDDMHGRYFEGSRLTVEWAKRLPSSMWRSGARSPRRSGGGGGGRYGRYRSRSPRRDRDYDKDDRRGRSRSPSRDRKDHDDRDDRDDDREDHKERHRSDSRDRKRSYSREDRSDRARTPPPPAADEDMRKENGVEIDNAPALSEA